jgi:hypothetical protein
LLVYLCCQSPSKLLTIFLSDGKLGDIKIEDLPGPEALLRPGKSIRWLKDQPEHSNALYYQLLKRNLGIRYQIFLVFF